MEAAGIAEVRSFGDVLRMWRKNNRISQQKLARRIGVDHSAVSRWESGDREPRRTELAMLLTVVDPHTHDIICDTLDFHPEGGKEKFARLMKRLREDRLVSRIKLAAALGVEVSTITRWEAGHAIPARETVEEVSVLLRLFPAEHYDLLVAAGYQPRARRQTLPELVRELEMRIARLEQMVDTTGD